MKDIRKRVALFFDKIKEHPVVAVLIVIGGLITALGTLTDSLDKIISSASRMKHALTETAQLSGQISYLVFWRFSSNSDGIITDRKFTPSFWVKNADE